MRVTYGNHFEKEKKLDSFNLFYSLPYKKKKKNRISKHYIIIIVKNEYNNFQKMLLKIKECTYYY